MRLIGPPKSAKDGPTKYKLYVYPDAGRTGEAFDVTWDPTLPEPHNPIRVKEVALGKAVATAINGAGCRQNNPSTARTPPCPDETQTIGLGLDIELADGTRAFLSGCDLVTDDTGAHVWLAFTTDQPVAIERRESGPFVTPHGIEN